MSKVTNRTTTNLLLDATNAVATSKWGGNATVIAARVLHHAQDGLEFPNIVGKALRDIAHQSALDKAAHVQGTAGPGSFPRFLQKVMNQACWEAAREAFGASRRVEDAYTALIDHGDDPESLAALDIGGASELEVDEKTILLMQECFRKVDTAYRVIQAMLSYQDHPDLRYFVRLENTDPLWSTKAGQDGDWVEVEAVNTAEEMLVHMKEARKRRQESGKPSQRTLDAAAQLEQITEDNSWGLTPEELKFQELRRAAIASRAARKAAQQ